MTERQVVWALLIAAALALVGAGVLLGEML